ncbi:hypothetical protein ElyMa_001378900 [Elysia marginata]|uniref:PHD-type domain-containing protein n=1 Tax=Elysia marginata TaxID=1093978 RepID=A0AAV4IUK4_9GAST|nr:hypothetical protein ElyMa_001378900 [Elysia marginata]
MMAPKFPCVACHKNVCNNQEAVQCDSCSRWQHCVCGTNISKTLYVQLTQSEHFAWTCSWCSPNLEPEEEAEDESPVQIVGTEEILYDAMPSFSFTIPMEVEEPSLLDEPVQAVANVAAEFQINPRATTRGRPLLVDAEGYSYGIHRRERSGVTHWRSTGVVVMVVVVADQW